LLLKSCFLNFALPNYITIGNKQRSCNLYRRHFCTEEYKFAIILTLNVVRVSGVGQFIEPHIDQICKCYT
jgi:hypothetical protein